MQGTSDPLNQVEISSEEKEFSFKDLLEAIWINKFLIIIFPLLVGSITALYTLTLPNMYRAEVLLASSESKRENQTMAQSGLAALAGVSLQSTDNKTLIGMETLKSRKFISEFLIRHEALPALMAPISWNSEEDILEIQDEITDDRDKEYIELLREDYFVHEAINVLKALKVIMNK